MMAGNAEIKPEALPDLDDLLQCPVCYEIPSGQIFQCNEGHHVCGRCKVRLDMCPVCRALFFGTRNYAMEELIANVRKLRAFKLGGKITTGAELVESSAPVDAPDVETESSPVENDENNSEVSSRSSLRAPQACKGLFRCLCCKNGNGERLPAARLLNHLRYFHSPDLIEGQSEDGEYVQLWQFSTAPGRIVTAVRVSDMGIFFLIIEISDDSICAWLSMAASPWVAHVFSYTVTISGNDREAIFSDCVWSVRSCEGSLKKRGHCLMMTGLDARALIAPAAISGKLSVRRTPTDQLAHQTQPRAVLRVASRGNDRDNGRAPVSHNLEPFLQDLQNDVARLSRAFATLGREANALVRSEAEMRSRIENSSRGSQTTNAERTAVATAAVEPPPTINNQSDGPDRAHLSRNARRRMRQRLRAALNATQPPADRTNALAHVQNSQVATSQRRNGPVTNTPTVHMMGLAIVQQPPAPPVPPPSASGPSHGHSQNGNHVRTNRKRRQRR
ncbi:uncharacterized protein LOC113522990 [Galleria mellonella]|uniref:Uncharacterized protein LOC113522990 n=1 Tax=Galleria mellonella TaxID=7137 RepID=A0ABM3MRV8_GALME|nr:uncharacterized protein LOC113522990 [Galleria mellonella]